MKWPGRSAPAAPPPVEFTFGAPDGHRLVVAPPAASPDGTKVAFGALDAKQVSSIWIRALDGTARRLDGTEGAVTARWAPDSQSLMFFRGGSWKRMSVGRRARDYRGAGSGREPGIVVGERRRGGGRAGQPHGAVASVGQRRDAAPAHHARMSRRRTRIAGRSCCPTAGTSSLPFAAIAGKPRHQGRLARFARGAAADQCGFTRCVTRSPAGCCS